MALLSLRRELVPVAWLAAAGIAVGLLWAGLAPGAMRAVPKAEAAAVGDGVFAGLCLVAGLVFAVGLLVRPGARPGLRSAIVIAGGLPASYLALRVGLTQEAPSLEAVSALLLWPLLTSSVVAVRSLIGVLLSP